MTHLILFLIALSYTLIRYTLFGPVPPSQISVFLINKAIALSAVLYLCGVAYFHSINALPQKKQWAAIAYAATGLHILLSLAILSPAYFQKFFQPNNQLTTSGGLVILSGAVAYLIWIKMRAESTTLHTRNLLAKFCTLLISIHLFAMGFSGWLTPAHWHGSLPPLSLLSFIVTLVALLFFSKKGHPSKEP